MAQFILGVLPVMLFGFLIGAGFGYNQREKEERRKSKKSIDRF